MPWQVDFADVQKRAAPGEVTAADQERVEELLGDALAEARRAAPQLAVATDVDVLRSATALVVLVVLRRLDVKPWMRSETHPEYAWQADVPAGRLFSEAELQQLRAMVPKPRPAGVYEAVSGMAHPPMGRR